MYVVFNNITRILQKMSRITSMHEVINYFLKNNDYEKAIELLHDCAKNIDIDYFKWSNDLIKFCSLFDKDYGKAMKLLHSYEKLKNEDLGKYEFMSRTHWIMMFKSWALPPTLDQLDEIYNLFKGMKILEVGAGNGLWSSILSARGLDVIATDDSSETKDECIYGNVEILDATRALEKYGDDVDVLFLCWCRGFITEKDLANFKGKYIMTIGEGRDGCTSNGCIDDLQKNHLEWTIMKEINIPHWIWIYDWLIIYERI